MTNMTTEGIPSLAQCLRDGEFITAPGVFDLVSARDVASLVAECPEIARSRH